MNHHFLSDDFMVQKTTWSNGTEIYVNFMDKNFDKDDLHIPARGFFLKNSPLGTKTFRIQPSKVVTGGGIHWANRCLSR